VPPAPTAGSVVLKAERLTLAYGPRTVLRDVTFEVRQGERWFFIGPNGCGKTTLLRAMLGLLAPRAGGMALAPDLADRARVGFIPQRYDRTGALPTTVREFVLLGTVGTGLRRAERAERLSSALAQVGIADLVDRDLWALSGGQRQRALLARALVRRPSLLILDEPTAGLDLAATDALLRFLADLNRQDVTLLVVSHDLATAACYASHVGLFDRGQLLSGPCDQVLTDANLERMYGVGMSIVREGEGTDRSTVSVQARGGP
jgi:ABC-type Mn2+/Zn2+ transport system ATPase subunit